MANDINLKVGVSGEREYNKSLREINAAMKTSAAEMKKAEQEFNANGDAAAREAKEIELLEKQLQLLIQKQQTSQQALGNAAAAYGENSTQAAKWRTNIVESETAIAGLKGRLTELKSGLNATGEAGENAAAGMGDLNESLDVYATTEITRQGIMAYAAALRALIGVMSDCVSAAVTYESAITGVYKTVDGTDEQLAAISEGIREMAAELPEATTELAAVAESAGQLGVQTDDVLDFTRVMTMLGTTTNLSADEAATALARFANVTGTAAENYERLGSTIVALGNNFATTESEITEMGQRLASAGTLAGLSEPEILALAAAMSSVGIEAEAGGTAMTQTLNSIEKAVTAGGESLTQYADIAGMSAEEFAAAWGDAPAEALSKFISGLGELSENGESSVAILDELGLSGVRQSNMLRSLALAGDQLTGAMQLANTAWQENNALANEAELRYATTESQLQLLSNANERLAAAYGSTLTPAISRFAAAGAKVSNGLAKLIEQNPKLGQTATAAATGVTALAGGVGLLSFGTAIKSCQALTAVLNTMKVAIFGNPLAMLAVGAASLAAALAAYSATAEEAATATDKLLSSVRESKQAFAETETEVCASAADTAAAYAAARARQAEADAQLAEVQAALAEQEAILAEYAGRNVNSIATDRVDYARYKEATETAAQLAGAEKALLAEQEELAAKYGAYTEGAAASAEATETLTQKVQTAVNNLNAMAVAYDEAKEAARESLDGQISLFEELSTEFDTTATDLESALDSQEKYLNDYAANLQKAMGKGVDAAILDQLTDGSEKSAEMLAALADATEETIDRINAKYAETEAARDMLAGTIAAYQTGADDVIAEAESIFDEVQQAAQMGDEMAQAGADALQGFIDGAKSMRAEGCGTMTELADAMLAAWRQALDEHSPSREFKTSGQNSIKGYTEGAKSMAGAMNDELAALAREGFAGFDSAAKAAATDAGVAIRAEMAAAWKAAQAAGGDFSTLRKALDNAFKADVFTEETYYKKLAALRQKYLTPTDSEYAQVGLELYQYTQELLENENKALDEACEEFLDNYEVTLQTAADTIKERLSAIADAYDEVTDRQADMADRLADYGDLYKTVKLSYSDGSSGEYFRVGDLSAQIDALKEYQAVLDELKERGLAAGLMEEVADLDVDDAVKYGRELLKTSDKQWEEYNRQWEEKQRLAQEIAERYYKNELSALKTEYADELQSGLDELKNIGYDSGGNVVGGLIEGMSDREDDLRQEMRTLCDAIEEELRSSLDMHSPSKRLEELAALAGEGLTGGFADKVDEFRSMIADAVPSDLGVNYTAQSGYKRDGNMVNALGTVLSGGNSGDLTIILRGGSDIEFARAVLPAFRRASAENPLVEVDF